MRWTAAGVAGASGLRHRRPDQLPRVTRKTLRRATWASEPSTGSSDGAASPPVTTNTPSTTAQASSSPASSCPSASSRKVVVVTTAHRGRNRKGYPRVLGLLCWYTR